MKHSLILLACTLLPLTACSSAYTPPPPAEWNHGFIYFVPLERQEREEMQRAFRDCASVKIVELRTDLSRWPEHFDEEEKTLRIITQGAELAAILAQLRAVPHWYRLKRKRGVHIQDTPQSAPGEPTPYLARRIMRFRDADGNLLWSTPDAAPICCAGPDGKPQGIFDIAERVRLP